MMRQRMRLKNKIRMSAPEIKKQQNNGEKTATPVTHAKNEDTQTKSELGRLEKIAQLNKTPVSLVEKLKGEPKLLEKCTQIKHDIKAQLNHMIDVYGMSFDYRTRMAIGFFITLVDEKFDILLARTIDELDIRNNPATQEAFLKIRVPPFKLGNLEDGSSAETMHLRNKRSLNTYVGHIVLDRKNLQNKDLMYINTIIIHELFHAFFSKSAVNNNWNGEYSFFNEGMTQYFTNLVMTTKNNTPDKYTYYENQLLIDALYLLDSDAVRTLYVTADYDTFVEKIAKAIEIKLGKTHEEAKQLALEIKEIGLVLENTNEYTDAYNKISIKYFNSNTSEDITDTIFDLIDNYERHRGNPERFLKEAVSFFPEADKGLYSLLDVCFDKRTKHLMELTSRLLIIPECNEAESLF